jgi:hypothetical protein
MGQITQRCKFLNQNGNDSSKVLKACAKLLTPQEINDVKMQAEGVNEEQEEIEEIKVMKEPCKDISVISMQNISKGSNGEYQKIITGSDENELKSNQDATRKLHHIAKKVLCIKDIETKSLISKKRAVLDEAEDLQFQEIYVRLSDIASKYPTNEDLLELLDKHSGNLVEVEKYLKGKPAISWTNLEDMALNQPPSNDMYKFLLKAKGRAAVLKRKHYLQLN